MLDYINGLAGKIEDVDVCVMFLVITCPEPSCPECVRPYVFSVLVKFGMTLAYS